MVVQRHERRRFISRFWRLWCEGFAPHTANSRLPILRCVPLHHWKRDRDHLCRDVETCDIIHHDEPVCMTWGGFTACIVVCGVQASHTLSLRCVVRRLRTTHRELSPSDSTGCAFAPRGKRPRLVRDEESCVITYHNESPWWTHGGVEIFPTLSC